MISSYFSRCFRMLRLSFNVKLSWEGAFLPIKKNTSPQFLDRSRHAPLLCWPRKSRGTQFHSAQKLSKGACLRWSRHWLSPFQRKLSSHFIPEYGRPFHLCWWRKPHHGGMTGFIGGCVLGGFFVLNWGSVNIRKPVFEDTGPKPIFDRPSGTFAELLSLASDA